MTGPRALPVIESRPAAVPWRVPWPSTAIDPGLQPSLLEPPGPPPQPEPAGWQSVPDPILPPASPWAATLAVAAVEVLRGRRPIGQLSRWVTDDVLALLAGRTLRGGELDGPPGRPPVQAQVQSTRAQHPCPDVAEAAVHIRVGPASIAVALRLEAVYDRWIATVLRPIGPTVRPGPVITAGRWSGRGRA